MGGAGGHRGTVGIEVSANGLKQVNLASGLRCFAPFVYPQQFLPWAQVLAAQRPSIAVSAGLEILKLQTDVAIGSTVVVETLRKYPPRIV